MEGRPYQCPICHSGFKTEGGMKCHLGRQHEMPAALDALGKGYDGKVKSLEGENANAKQRLTQIERDLDDSKLTCLKKDVEILQKMVEIDNLRKDFLKAVLGIAARDIVLKKELNTSLPSPFAEVTGKSEGGATNADLI